MASVNVGNLDDPSQKIYLVQDTLDKLELKYGETVNIRAGSSVTQAEVSPSRDGNFLTWGTLGALGLPNVNWLRLKRDGPQSLQVGPLIGILIKSGNKYKVPPYSSQSKLLQFFSAYGIQAKCLVFVFTPSGVDLLNKNITGLFLDVDSDGRFFWKRHVFPLPDIVYDRILFRNFERKKITKQVSSFLAGQQNVIAFNPKFLNKWETHSILHRQPELQPHLPETAILNSPNILANFLERYQTVYLKPVNGSLGKDIIRVSSIREGFSFQYRQGKKNITGFWQTPEELETQLGKYINKRLYIIQQGLDFLKYRDRVFDLRILVQKNSTGEWGVSAMVARVAANGSIFPNVAAGGEPLNIETVWQELADEAWLASTKYETAANISLLAAKTLEDSLGTFVEIGLDIGVDTNGNVWIIEINSKPSYKVFPKDQLHLKTMSIHKPIDFAAYMAGFAAEQELQLL